MQELNVTFTPASGDPPRVITLRIGSPVRGEHSWSARFEITGLDETHAATCHGADWAQAIELTAMLIPVALHGIVGRAGGGTLDPPFYQREARDLSKIPPEIRAILDTP